MLNQESKSIKSILWNVPEQEYRSNPAFSYSGIAAYAKSGPSALIDATFKESASLRNGSLLDCMLTNPAELDELFAVVQVPEISEKNRTILDTIWSRIDNKTAPLETVPQELLAEVLNENEFYSNWKLPTRISKLIEIGAEYYKLLPVTVNKTIVPIEAYEKTVMAAELLKTKDPFSKYFVPNPFSTTEIIFQAKFTTILNGIPVRIMTDILIVDHENKIIYIKDLKSTSGEEEHFASAFLTWRYDIQGTLYKDVVLNVISQDEYFKDFEIADFSFIVININNLNPIEWVLTDKFLNTLYTKTKHKPYPVLLEEIIWHQTKQVYTCTKETYLNNFVREIELPFTIRDNE